MTDFELPQDSVAIASADAQPVPVGEPEVSSFRKLVAAGLVAAIALASCASPHHPNNIPGSRTEGPGVSAPQTDPSSR